MQKVVNAVDIRRNLGEFLENSYYRGDEFIIERFGKPMAAIVPIQELKLLTQLRQRCFQALDQLRGSFKDAQISNEAIEEAIKWVRTGKYVESSS